MDWFGRAALKGPAEALYGRLREERLIWDRRSPADLEVLRRDVERIAADMDDPDRPPPMFWSGIPLPRPVPQPSCDYHLVVSVGGTKTDFALLRLERGKVIALNVLSGREVSDPAEIDRVKCATQLPTPKHCPATPSGALMFHQIVRHLTSHLGPHRAALERCQAILLSWGFAHRVIRTGPRLAGGLSARVTRMTKDQVGFTRDLAGKDIAVLFERELRAQLGWSRPIAVANDTVMALHYFLARERWDGYARPGLFINGTGTNFSAAEPYAVRPEGALSRNGEDYTPERITPRRPRLPFEEERLFFVNYEAGSIELGATRTRFDTDPEYPIERNVLAGGNAFGRGLEALVQEFVSRDTYRRIRERWSASGTSREALPGAPVVAALSDPRTARDFLGGPGPWEEDLPRLQVTARAIIARSALHAALVLCAITRRTGFGRGTTGLPDLLGMEGSVWKISGYQDLVKAWWQELLGEPLWVDFAAEPSYNASLSGPLYLAALHQQAGAS